ncbi:MAG TPA: hypothetical protein DCX07_01735 [Phycisphaerales bacterium]|nr:hypothetical protein [Phycisphaerales bacterium]
MDKKQTLIRELQGIAKNLDTDTVPRHEFLRRTGISEREVQGLFGSYNELVKAAGLTPRFFPTSDAPTYSDEDLLNELVRVLRLPESKLTRGFFEQNASVSASACERRFGGWINTIKLAAERLDPDKDTELLARIREYAAPKLPARHIAPSSDGEEQEEPPGTSEQDMYEANHSVLSSEPSHLYGDFINFRGLQHAPVNEQGVVFLFGMICRELGYVVEIVKPGFPDCEAKRRVQGRPGKWQRVRIEFEYESRNFRAHGHDPDQCDVIVCWEHNWAECPIEVLELRSAMRRLAPNDQGTA